MSYIPYSCQTIADEDIESVVRVLRSEYLTQGPSIAEFEAEFARVHEVPHAVAVSSATAALHLTCLAMGVGPGSRVWTSPNSFVASANCARYCGATVDFVDIDERTRNMSVELLEDKLCHAQERGTLPTVVIPVDFAGFPCDLDRIWALSARYGFRIVEDASHATGAQYQGRPVGTQYSHASVFSFHAVKVVTTAEGGIITTRDPELADRLRLLRSHGITRDASKMIGTPEGSWYYEQQALGFNYRMTDVAAALGSSQLRRLTEMQAARDMIATRYDSALSHLPLILPVRSPDRGSAWHLYVVEVDDSRTARSRADVFQHLRARGIGANVHYIPIHTQPYYTALGFKVGDFPSAERYYRRALSIPIFPRLTEEQQGAVIAALEEALST